MPATTVGYCRDTTLRPELPNSVFVNPAAVAIISVIQVDLVLIDSPDLRAIPEIVGVKWRSHHVTLLHISHWLTLHQ